VGTIFLPSTLASPCAQIPAGRPWEALPLLQHWPIGIARPLLGESVGRDQTTGMALCCFCVNPSLEAHNAQGSASVSPFTTSRRIRLGNGPHTWQSSDCGLSFHDALSSIKEKVNQPEKILLPFFSDSFVTQFRFRLHYTESCPC